MLDILFGQSREEELEDEELDDFNSVDEDDSDSPPTLSLLEVLDELELDEELELYCNEELEEELEEDEELEDLDELFEEELELQFSI